MPSLRAQRGWRVGSGPPAAAVASRGPLVLRGVTLALAVGLATGPALATRLVAPELLGLLGFAGVAFVAGAVWRWAALVGPGVTALGAEYAVVLAGRGATLDAWAPLEAAALLLLAELAYACTESHPAVAEERPVLVARVAFLAACVLGALAVGTALLAVAAVPLAGDVARLTAGGLAAAVTLGLIAAVARRRT